MFEACDQHVSDFQPQRLRDGGNNGVWFRSSAVGVLAFLHAKQPALSDQFAEVRKRIGRHAEFDDRAADVVTFEAAEYRRPDVRLVRREFNAFHAAQSHDGRLSRLR